jgi:O-antigen ligase
LLLTGFGVWSLVVWVLSPFQLHTVAGTIDLISSLAFIEGVRRARIGRPAILVCLVVIACGGAGLGLLEQWFELSLGAATRPASVFASRATAGALMAATIPLAWLVWGRRTWLGSSAIALQTAFLVSTRARAAWGGAAIACVVILLLVPRSRRVLALGLALGVAVAQFATPGPLLKWVSDSPYRDSLQSLATVQVGDRFEVWTSTLRLSASRPMGFGAGSFEPVFGSLAGPEIFHDGDVRLEAPHNEALRLLLELGAPSIVLILALLWPRWSKASAQTWALRAAAVALLACSCTGKTLLEPPTLLLACCVVGLLLRASIGRPRTGAHVGGTTKVLVRWQNAAVASVLGLACAITDGTEVARSRRIFAAHEAASAGAFREAWGLISPALETDTNLGDFLWAAELLDGAGDDERRAELVARALTLFPRHPLLLARQKRCGVRALESRSGLGTRWSLSNCEVPRLWQERG